MDLFAERQSQKRSRSRSLARRALIVAVVLLFIAALIRGLRLW
jgi:hypothetical protein